MKKLSIVVPVFNKSNMTFQCLNNLLKVCLNIDHEILIIDDWSTDDTTQVVQQFRTISNNIRHYKFDKNVGVTKARNKGVEFALGEYVCVINNDVVFKEGHFQKLMDWFSDPKENVIMTCPRFTEGMNVFAWRPIYYDHHVNGHCFMFKNSMKHKLFPIDERLIIFGNDNRLRFHLKDQWYNLKLVKDAICHHYKSQTSFFVPNKDMPIFQEICAENSRQIFDVKLPDRILEHDLIF